MFRFATRDVLWLTAVVALLALMAVQRRPMSRRQGIGAERYRLRTLLISMVALGALFARAAQPS